ncbi:ubiquitin-protein ligase ASR1 [Saccharomyces paradoxus]|uniref:Ubiquitin-protein ligase ASR1 n=1 Tax=Saccharomyces paradoxus TaxID=27291 RepID=A0A8B8V1E8_SACPA|nr:Asr1 [Saccharomyces paradoxus]QHS76808.1 Asr1 [Saccharomyces paradoxus]
MQGVEPRDRLYHQPNTQTSYKNMEECPICLGDDQECEQFGRLEVCRHKFHLNCIREWHKYSIDLKCPICRIESNHLEVGEGQHAVSINLKMGFMIKNAIEYVDAEATNERNEDDAGEQDQEMEILSERFQDRLVMNTIKIIQCSICGDTDVSRLNLYCQDCEAIYHETCLRGLAYEVGDRNTWQECTDCRSNDLLQLRMGANRSQLASYDSRNCMIFAGVVRDKHSVKTQQMYDRIRNAKHKIQIHVRRALDRYPLPLLQFRDAYKHLNKQVSRKLYRLSDNKYLPAHYDYDSLARTGVHTELLLYCHVEE